MFHASNRRFVARSDSEGLFGMGKPALRISLIGLLLVLFTLGVAACGDDDDDGGGGGGSGDTASQDGGGGPEPIKTAVLLNGKADDQTWNTSMTDSVERVKDEIGLDIINTLESVSPADGARAMREVIEQGGAEMVVLHASALDQATKEVAAEHPEVCFVQAFGTEEPGPSTTFYFDDASGANYLAGMAAASVSKSGTLGVVGGVDLDEIVETVEAFKNGAKKIKPDSNVLVTWVGDFEDPLKGKEAGLAQIQRGADVLYAYGDGTGLGTVEAAKEKNVPLIGAWFDQYELAPELMITSFVTDWAPVLTQVAEKFRADGAEACGLGVYVADLKNKGVLLAPYHDYDAKLDADVKKQIDEAQAAIIAGTLDPVTGKTK
jgi:basic membrane protein A